MNDQGQNIETENLAEETAQDATELTAAEAESAETPKKHAKIKLNNTTKNLILTALFSALCIVLPMAFHAVPQGGLIFCPMHIPVLLCAMICGWQYGLVTALVGPTLSMLLTGMPNAAVLPSIVLRFLATLTPPSPRANGGTILLDSFPYIQRRAMIHGPHSSSDVIILPFTSSLCK